MNNLRIRAGSTSCISCFLRSKVKIGLFTSGWLEIIIGFTESVVLLLILYPAICLHSYKYVKILYTLVYISHK